MAIARFGFLVALSALLAGCGPDNSPPALQYASLSGRVYDTATGQPIAGAVVSVNTNFQQSAPTGSNGVYSIANLPPGAVTVYATAPNYHDSSPIDDSLVSNAKNSLDIGLTHN
jgi:hypothetical protein